MKTYSIYWIEEEIAQYYLHKGELLYRFFSEYHERENNIVLQKQFHYITKQIPQHKLHRHINSSLHIKRSSKNINDLILFSLDHDPIYVALFNRQIKFQCDMLHDAERYLFPLLKEIQPFLFVVGDDHDNYGWMSPPTQFKLDYHKQILYS
ncbi:sporulation inhibitor of replication protein SirA [Lentibacillus saliphilus]|uniref:sporulation inhibitor of replication protein SirA n=1 Tax=Lentibacillus saliphilus TaxID=2737028 RepID=UPI001C2FAECD|nr:sporulation inhibitor of replication protein SirA [Lentibacillus saliphilus]